MPKRGENIFKRTDGRWEARYIHHYENGKAKYRYLYAHSYTEAKAKQRAEIKYAEKFFPAYPKNSATLEALAKLYLDHIKIGVKESTYTRYHRILHKYILPDIGKLRIDRMDAQVMNKFAERLLISGGAGGKALAPKTVSDILCLLRSVMKYGEENGFPPVSLSALRLPQKPHAKVEILSAESRKMLEAALLRSEDATSLGILFALFTGVRIGELCGLRWGDIDLRSRTAVIRRTVERIADLDPLTPSKTKVIISEPKTESSVRTIPLPTFLAEYMRRMQKSGDIYLVSDKTEFTEPHCFYMRYKNFLKKNGIGNYTFHALRHTFATQCVEYGFDTKSLAEILGHSSVTTTMAFYVHPTIEQKRAQMELLAPPSKAN